MTDKTKILTLLYKTDVPNANGHIYPRETVRKAFEEYSKRIKHNVAFGTLGQKTPFDRNDYMNVDVQQTSHMIKHIEEKPEGFNITALVLHTPKGKLLSKMIDKKQKLSFGTRGVGKIAGKVIKDFKLISVDVLKDE